MKKILLVCFSFAVVLNVWAQDRVVSGKVTTSEDGSALPGVSVVLKGTTSGTVTDAEGNYKVTVPGGGGTLGFSFIGYVAQEAAVGERSTIDISLVADITQLSEVIVTAVGISRDTKTLGYSVASVKNEQLNQARVTNVAAALSGKVSGLLINQVDNSLNGAPRVVLRGNRSFLGNNQALVVLDGVQVSSDYLNSINPNDIESVNVIKGAGGAALYGSAASNGVLLINTKNGSSSKAPEIVVSRTTQFDKVSYLPNLQTRFGLNGGEDFADSYSLPIDPNFNTPYTPYENQSYGPEFNGSIVPLGKPLANGSQQYTTYDSKLDDHKKFFDTGVTNQSDVSYSSGDDKGTFYISAQDVTKTGVIPKDKSRRDAFRFNGSRNYGIFKAKYSIQYTLSDQDINTVDLNGNTVYWLWMNTGIQVPLTQYKDWQNNQHASLSGWYNDYYQNPYWAIDNNRRKQSTSDFLGNLELSVQPTKWLNLLSRVGLTTRGQENTINTGRIEYDLSIANPSFSSLSTPGTTPASTSNTYINTKRINADFLATASHSFSPDLSVKAILGANVFDEYLSGINVSSANLIAFTPAIYNTQYRNGNLSGGSGSSTQRKYAVYGDLSATYKFVSIHGTYRNDWTSLLADGNNSFGFPSADASIVLTDAIPALKDSQILNFAKFTASWAKSGNVNLNPYATVNPFNAGTPFSSGAGNVPVIYQGSSVIGKNLLPEFTTSKEIGLDLRFLEDKINLKTAYYESNTINQTVPFSVSTATGFTRVLINTGEMENKGLEFDLNVTPVNTSSGLKISVGANYTDIISNKPLSLYTSPTGDVISTLQVSDNGGQNLSQGVGVGTQGNSLNSFAIIGEQYPTIRTYDYLRDPDGRVIVNGTTGLPSRDPNLKSVGQANARHRLGLSTNVSYKGLFLSVLLDYRAGNVIYNQLGQDIEFAGLGYKSSSAGRQRFVWPNSVIKNADGSFSPNTNITTNDGNINFWTSNNYRGVGTNYISDAAFWKLRELALGYNVPKAVLEKIKYVKGMRLTLTGRNLFMWRPISNQWTDPEFSGDNSNSAGTTTSYQNPPTRTYGVNLTLTF